MMIYCNICFFLADNNRTNQDEKIQDLLNTIWKNPIMTVTNKFLQINIWTDEQIWFLVFVLLLNNLSF